MLREKIIDCEYEEPSVDEKPCGCCPTCGQKLDVKMIALLDPDEADKAELVEELQDLLLFADDV